MQKLTNMRAASADDFVKLAVPLELNLDKAVEYIQDDELVEVTPTQVRMLKNPDMKVQNYKNVMPHSIQTTLDVLIFYKLQNQKRNSNNA